ncbi:MAG: DUF333 domain-containing protein [Candidatus Gracilibacteria bacterium]|nr:DUF333 domain-containing protein [Candidatus Gracilibacteria bacterium]
MKTRILLGIATLFILASCTLGSQKVPPANPPMPTAPSGASIPDVTYPTSQSDSLATKFCTSKGGSVSIESSGGVDMAYCTLTDGTKVDAWQYMNTETSKNTP